MPAEGASVETEESTLIVGDEPAADGNLTDEQLRALAEILYKIILDELRIERERLGR